MKEENEPVTVVEESVKYAIDLMRSEDKSPEMVAAIRRAFECIAKVGLT